MSEKFLIALTDGERMFARSIADAPNMPKTYKTQATILLMADRRSGKRYTQLGIAMQLNVSMETVQRTVRDCYKNGIGYVLMLARAHQMGLDTTTPPAELNQTILRAEWDDVVPQMWERRAFITKAQEAQIIALVHSEPPEPHSRWSLRLLAKSVVERGILPHASCETIRKLLMKHKITLETQKRVPITAAQGAQIIALVHSEPPEPYSRWSLRLLAKEVVERGILPHASSVTMRKLLMKHEIILETQKRVSITKEQEAQIIALAHSKPPSHYLRWTQLLITEEAIKRGIIPRVGYETVRKILVKHKITFKKQSRLYITAEQEVQIIDLAHSTPPEAHSRWTLRLLAEEVVKRGILPHACYGTIRKILVKHKITSEKQKIEVQ